MRVIDLFAGVGGMSEGFRQAGYDIALAIEFDKDIAYSYKRNHVGTDVINEDICKLDAKQLHEKYQSIDVIMGGPPCQGFSQKGKRLNLDDPRNYLFQQFVRFVDEFRPKYFVLENVPNIITTSKGFFKDQIIKSFERLGYSVNYGILNASNYGVPQDRHRAVFIGKLGTEKVSMPAPLKNKVSIKDAIYDLPFLKSGEGEEVSSYDKEPTTSYESKMRGSCTVLHNHVATKHSSLALRRLSMIPKGAGKEILPQEERTKSIYSGTWSRMIEDDISVTITTRYDTPSSGRFTHPILDRCITTREAARIQSFPDSFVFYGTKTSQMKQVGNAVPPLLAKAIAEHIKNDNNE